MISNVLSFILSVLFAFITNKLFVFKSNKKDKIIKELISFFSSRVFTFLIDMFMMYMFVSVLKLNDMISKIVVQIVVIILNYLLSKMVVFNNK